MGGLGGPGLAERQMERSVESAVRKDLNNGCKAIGRPLGLCAADKDQSINWHDFNYPPCIKLMHYDKDELPTNITQITTFQKLFFELQFFVCSLNLFNTIALCLMDPVNIPPHFILFSMLNLVIFPSMMLFVFHQGYKGLALSSASMLTQYKAVQGLSMVFDFICFLIPLGCINGLLRFRSDNYKACTGGTRVYYGFAILSESSCYAISMGIAGFSILQTHKFNPYATQGSGGSNSI